jgi:hypothetical protein
VTTRRLPRLMLKTVVASLPLLVGGCFTAPPEEETPAEPDDVAYDDGTNSQGLRALLAAPLEPEIAPTIVYPKPGAAVTDVFFVEYEAGPTAQPPTDTGAASPGDPMNGTAFLLTFATESDPKYLRVFTTETKWIPFGAAWQKITSAPRVGEGEERGPDLTLTVRMGTFEQGRLASGGGPFESAPVSFLIGSDPQP